MEYSFNSWNERTGLPTVTMSRPITDSAHQEATIDEYLHMAIIKLVIARDADHKDRLVIIITGQK